MWPGVRGADVADHLAPEIIDSYRAGTLPPDRLLDVDDHLAGCQDCRTRAAGRLDPAAATALLRTMGRNPSSLHCTYETLEAYVDGRLAADEGQQVLAHVEGCATCAEDLGDLRQARALLSTEVAASPTQQGLMGALASLWSRRWISVTGGALAAALGVWLVLAIRTPNEQPGDKAAAGAAGDTTPVTTGGGATEKPPAPVLASIRDGSGEVVLRASGDLSGLPALSGAARDAVAAALTSGRLSVVAITTLNPRIGTLRGTEAERGFEVVEPVGRVVESDRPTFRWSAHPSASAYRVAAFDTSFSEVAASAEISATEWTPSTPLPRGKTLIWQVTAVTPNGPVQAPTPPAPEARFAVLDRAQADELERVRRTDPESHLALAVLYARAGMREEAEREAQALAQRNPDSSLARTLAASVRPPQ
jgi:Putative zinc-finger